MYCLVCRQKISRWRRLKTGSEFCSEEHLEQYQKEAVGRLLEYHESKSSQPADEDPIHRLALIDVGPTMAEEPRHLGDLQPFKAMEVRRYNPARATNLWLFHNGSAIPPRPQLPLEVHPLTLWDPSLLAPARSSGSAAPPPPLISRPAPDPIASLLKALPATTAGPVWVDLRLLDPGLPSLPARPLWEGPRLAGNGRQVHQPSLANPGGMPARSTGLGNARPVGHCLPLAIPLSPGGPPTEVAGTHLRICTAMPAICLVHPGVLDQAALSRPRRQAAGFRELATAFREPDPQPWRVSDLGVWPDRPPSPRYMPGTLDRAVFVPARTRTAGFRELAGALRESEPQSWRPPDLGTWSHRPGHPVQMPNGPPPRNLAAVVRPPRVARPRVSTPLPPVPGEMVAVPAIWLGPRFLDRVGIRRIQAAAEPGPPLRRPEPPPPELNPVPVVQAWGLTPGLEVARCRPLAPSVALGHVSMPIRTEAAPAPPPSAAHLLSGPLFPPQPVAHKLMAADKAGAWPSPADTRQAGPAVCGARPPEVSPQHLTPPGFVTVRRGPPAPAGQFIELKPHADKVGARQMLAPVPAGPGGSALQQVALPGPQPQTTAPPARRAVKLPPPEPLPMVGRDADQDHIAMGALARPGRPGKPVPDATVEQTADSLRLALEQSRRAREGLTARLPRQAALAWHEIVLPALASRRAKAGLLAALVLILSLWSFRDPQSMTNAALRWAVQPIQARSYFLLEENFQQGANAWTNPEALLRGADGLVEIQSGLSLYRPSLERQDYEFGFSGLIRKGALGWVVRASDANNYYAFKLARQGTGRDRRSVLLRYAVINGAPADKPHVSAVPFDVEENKLYQVMVQVSGERVTTIISDRGVDSCADSRLKGGGVGFFAEPGETGLVHSLSVSGNDDPTGRAIVWVRDFYRFCTRQSSATHAGK